MKRIRTLFLLASCLTAVFLSGCHTLTTSVHGGNPPTFSFSAGRLVHCCNYLEFLVVSEVPPENINAPWTQHPKENTHLWWIWPKEGTNNYADALPEITYGVVPPGFRQSVPAEGPPPPLIEGKVYEVGGPAISVPKSYIRFEIRDGRARQLPIPAQVVPQNGEN